MEHGVTQMNTQAIAQHLNLTEEQILEVQAWDRVLWVRIKGMRPKFVSKKVAEMKSFEQLEKEQDELADKAEAMAAELNKHLPIGNCVAYSKLHSAAVDVLEGSCSFQEALERFTSKKVIKKK